jgi:hypothetical protein
MRYGILLHHEDGDDSPHPYFVVDSTAPSIGQGMMGPKYSKAEAEIFAFALSAIASGGLLCVIEPALQGTLFAEGYHVVTYDGSTAGIA